MEERYYRDRAGWLKFSARGRLFRRTHTGTWSSSGSGRWHWGWTRCWAG